MTLCNAISDLPPVDGGWRPDGRRRGWADYSAPRTAFQREMREGVRLRKRARSSTTSLALFAMTTWRRSNCWTQRRATRSSQSSSSATATTFSTTSTSAWRVTTYLGRSPPTSLRTATGISIQNRTERSRFEKRHASRPSQTVPLCRTAFCCVQADRKRCPASSRPRHRRGSAPSTRRNPARAISSRGCRESTGRRGSASRDEAACRGWPAPPAGMSYAARSFSTDSRRQSRDRYGRYIEKWIGPEETLEQAAVVREIAGWIGRTDDAEVLLSLARWIQIPTCRI